MGHFIDFYLEFDPVRPGNNPEQAAAIISKAREQLSKGATKVAIIYSANYNQTVAIHKTYDSGGWETKITGSNQCEVMMAMEDQLGTTDTDLQGKLEIAPISTMTYPPAPPTYMEIVQADLDHIKSLIENGADVLGWINQKSKPYYAIGGGVKATLEDGVHDLVQDTLSQFAKDYPETK